MLHKIPDEADILIHAGDFTSRGDIDEIQNFNDILASMTKINYKIVIAGNHEISFDQATQTKKEHKIAKTFLKDCIYLEDSFAEVLGLKIYGSPW
jgi:predicted phosphodiesterase